MKILVSFLGKGNYREVVYRIDDQEYPSKLSIWAIKEAFAPEKIYVIGTKDSSWDLLQEQRLSDIESIKIPPGRNEKELWEIIDIISREVALENSEVIFDITHCFRSIPLFLVVLIKFLKVFSKNVKIDKILYGYLDEYSRESMIVDLAPLVELLELIDAVNSFERYGDPEDICHLISEKEKKYRKEFPKSLREINRLLSEMGAVIKMTYVPRLNSVAGKLGNSLQKLEEEQVRNEINAYFKSLTYMFDRFKIMARRFKIDQDWLAQLEVAKWYNENRHPSQALLTLREAIITYGCSRENKDPYKYENREQIEERYNKKRMNSDEPIHKLWNKVIDYRNKTAHILTGTASTINPGSAIEKVGKLIEEAVQILGAENVG